MRHRIRTIADACLLFPMLACLALAQEQNSSNLQRKWSLDRSAEAEVVFGKGDRYFAALLCCWRIQVREQQDGSQAIIWDWGRFDGGVGQKNDFIVQDVDGDLAEEVAFQITRLNLCLELNEAVLYSPGKRILFLLKFDGDAGLHLSPNLKDNQKAREWLVKYWQERRRVDLEKIAVTYDAEP